MFCRKILFVQCTLMKIDVMGGFHKVIIGNMFYRTPVFFGLCANFPEVIDKAIHVATIHTIEFLKPGELLQFVPVDTYIAAAFHVGQSIQWETYTVVNFNP